MLRFPRFASLFPFARPPCLSLAANNSTLCGFSGGEGLLWPIRLASHRQMNGKMTAEGRGIGEQEARMRKKRTGQRWDGMGEKRKQKETEGRM